jgi:hypothetical protein
MEPLSCRGCGRRISAKEDRCPYCDQPNLSSANARYHWKANLLIDFTVVVVLPLLAAAGGAYISIGLAVLLYSGGIVFLIVRRRNKLDIEGTDDPIEGPDDPNDNPPRYDNPPRWLVRTD